MLTPTCLYDTVSPHLRARGSGYPFVWHTSERLGFAMPSELLTVVAPGLLLDPPHEHPLSPSGPTYHPYP